MVCRTDYELETMETLLDYVLEIDCAKPPGYLWYDYDSDKFSPTIRHPLSKNVGLAYEARPMLADSPLVPRQVVPDYYQQAIGFNEDCLEPPVDNLALLPMAPSVTSTALVTAVISAHFENTIEVSIGPVVSAPIHLVPVIPEAITNAFEDLKGVCKSVGLAVPIGIARGLGAAHSWARRASRYHSMVQRNQEVKEAPATILE